jgi:dGTPase
LITLEQLADVDLFARFHGETVCEFPALQGRRVLYESIRRMLSAQVYDVIDATRAALEAAAPADVDAARRVGPLVMFSEPMREKSAALKQFLLHKLYRHPQVSATTGNAKQVVRELFTAYLEQPAQMAPDYAARDDAPRAVADYIAGMTDRFATREHQRLTGRRLFT